VEWWSKVCGLGRFARDVHRLLESSRSIEDAKRSIEEGIRRRPERFLNKIEQTVHQNPHSPYRQLLEWAGCELGDVRSLVEKEGLDGALRVLRQADVRLSYEEFKCRIPTVRGSRTFHFREHEFNDPLISADVETSSGGSRGAPVRAAIDVDHISLMASHWAVFLAENRCLDSPLVFWTTGHAGVVSRQLGCAAYGRKYSHWFVAEPMTSLKDRLYGRCVHAVARRAAGFPRPERVAFNQPERVLERLRILLAEGKTPGVNAAPSAAAALAQIAGRGGGLEGVVFLLGSEPLSGSCRRAIEASGARAAPLYGSSEAPWIGGQCRSPEAADEVHLLPDGYAVISGEDAGDESGESSRLLLTSLHPASPKVLLNTDIGDRGVISRRECGCLYDQMGCHVCLHTIRSSDKITTFGVTFAVYDVGEVIEEALPRVFGGVLGDYQLVEMVGAGGQPHYALLVNPELGAVDDESIISGFLAELAKRREWYGAMTAVWARENLLEVRRRQPIRTPRGKRLPFYRLRDSG
jgi:hypothetical protein